MSNPLQRLNDQRWPEIRVNGVSPFVLRDADVSPVRGSFGAMSYRPGLFLRIDDDQGHSGYGEVWANFPIGGAEYKAGLIAHYAAPLLAGQTFEHPTQGFDLLQQRLLRLKLQSGDYGAFSQICAGLDQALWDLFCKRAGAPFWRLAGGQPEVGVYASGIGPEQVGATIRTHAEAGHDSFKIKLGFGDDIDLRNLDEARAALPPGARLFVDANQAWDVDEAERWLRILRERGIGWCEEPVRADTPVADWARLAAAAGPMALAAGENLLDLDALAALAREGGVRVIQPDLGKWGGITGALRLHARLGADVWLCPHWLSGAIGQAASLQLSAAVRSNGPVEVDSNPNRLRSEIWQQPLTVRAGRVRLGEAPGLIPPLRPEQDWARA